VIDVLTWNGDGADGVGSQRDQYESDFTGTAELARAVGSPRVHQQHERILGRCSRYVVLRHRRAGDDHRSDLPPADHERVREAFATRFPER
jgi:hypothetical protein